VTDKGELSTTLLKVRVFFRFQMLQVMSVLMMDSSKLQQRLRRSVSETGICAWVEIALERSPNFHRKGAGEQQVIRVFIKVAGEAGGAGREVVSEPPLVGREMFLLS
jgi:hypothetical protein